MKNDNAPRSAASLSAIPAAIRNYVRALRTAPKPSLQVAEVAEAGPEFVYEYSTADRTYSSQQYPNAGTWAGTTTPWLNDLASVPSSPPSASWQWSAEDIAAQTVRGTQVNEQVAAMKPPGGYSGSTAQQIEQRYSEGMWSNSVFSQAQLDSLFVWLDDDAEFARQRLGGTNTNVIASAASFDVAGWIGAASNSASLGSLESAMVAAQAAGALYICDYRPVLGSVVSGELVQKNSFLAAPICFFQVVGSALQPMAIQIQGNSATSYIFTPADGDDPWLLAKLWVAHADAMWWYSGSHLYNTHSIDMIFGIAALNQMSQTISPLPADHPMLVLARPHLVKSFNINTAVYNLTFDPSQPVSDTNAPGIYQTAQFCDQVLPTGRIGIYEIINNLYVDYDFDGAAFDSNMEARGLDSGAIGKIAFPYRDDGGIWWNAIQGFVGNIVDASYASDAAVSSDAALNAWMKQVQTAFNTNQGSAARFTWTPTKAALVRIFSNLLFVCSVQHTSVNNSMFNGWGFTPNGPFAMQAAPPVDATSVTQALVLASLPDPTKAGNSGATVGSPATDMALIQNQVTFVMSGTAGVSELLAGTAAGAESLHAVYTYGSGTEQYTAVTNFYNAVWSGSGSVKAQVSGNQSARIAAFGSQPVPNTVSYYYFSAEAVQSMYLNAAATRAIQI